MNVLESPWPSTPHLPQEVDVPAHSLPELRASAREHQLVALHPHPVLLLLGRDQAGVRHVAVPYLDDEVGVSGKIGTFEVANDVKRGESR